MHSITQIHRLIDAAHHKKGQGPDRDKHERKSGVENSTKRRGNLNTCEKWVSHVASLEDGYLHFMLLICILIFTKNPVFQSAKSSGLIK